MVLRLWEWEVTGMHFVSFKVLYGSVLIQSFFVPPFAVGLINRGFLTFNSTEEFSLINFTKNEHRAWSFIPETKVTLPGAHNSDIVRSFCFLDSVGFFPFLIHAL